MTERRPVIALVTDAIGPYHHGGKELRYLELANRLAQRADVHVYTMKWWEGPATWSDGAVTYHALSPLLPLYSGGRRSIRQAIVFAIACLRLLGERFDVIEADHMPYMQLFSLKLVALVRRRRLVVTWHEYWGRDYWQSYLGRAGRLGWLCESLATRLPDMIIAASPETATRLRDVTRSRVEVVVAPNGINLDLIGEVEADAARVDVVVVGRLLPHKRVDLLLEALAILRGRSRPVTARVVGNGPQLEALVTKARMLGLIDCVDFRQDVDSDRDLFGMLKAARVAVFPSEREGFGIAVLEALACGVPVITTSAPDNLARHLVDRSLGGGLVCEPSAHAIADAIGSVLDRSGAPAALDSSWLREYDWGAITDRVAAALW
jgi:glycosyltransferase involved in cell wall biosynthesis